MLPIEFKERMTRLLGEDSSAFFDEIENGRAVRSFRVNEIKAKAEAIEGLSIDRKKADFPEECYYTEEQFPGYLPCHHAGMIYMQDPSAMATIHAVKVEKGMKILDSCSAPGGKTTQLASLAGDRGIVVANEYDTKRCRILQSNVERLGARNTVVTNLDTAVLAETYPCVFDVVLCDAPCSGEGMFRKNSLAIEEWSPQNVEMCAERQREILTNVAKCVAKGGRLIYSTCTFSLEENEMNVRWFLDSFPDFALAEVEESLLRHTSDGIMLEGCDYDMKLTRRFYPHVSMGEGQFIAVFERHSGGEVAPTREKKDKNGKKAPEKPQKADMEALKLAREFLAENIVGEIGAELILHNGSVYLKPNIALPKFGVFAPGVCVGEVMGRRLVPHHQLFSAYGTMFARKICLCSEDHEASDYLHGMEIGADKLECCGKADGFAAVLIDGCAVGGGKTSSGVCKNHYPKGLRNQK